ncbi:hypothetical protein PIB30_112946, partial [Stylosanthes scabra]|nr:hypothetical protein [Stylosanthes scabra]
SEDHTLVETMRRIRKRKNEEKEEKNNKKKKQPHGKSPANVEPEHEPPQQPRQLEEETPIEQPRQLEEETVIQQPQPQPQQQPPQDDVIDLSSCSDDEQPPNHMDVLHPLVPKIEELQEDQPPPVLEQPSQTVVEVV